MLPSSPQAPFQHPQLLLTHHHRRLLLLCKSPGHRLTPDTSSSFSTQKSVYFYDILDFQLVNSMVFTLSDQVLIFERRLQI